MGELGVSLGFRLLPFASSMLSRGENWLVHHDPEPACARQDRITHKIDYSRRTPSLLFAVGARRHLRFVHPLSDSHVRNAVMHPAAHLPDCFSAFRDLGDAKPLGTEVAAGRFVFG